MNTQMSKERLPDEEVSVKMSLCGTCEGLIRVAVEHEMDNKSKKAFALEVLESNLSVKTMPLLEYRDKNPDWCECED